MSGIDVSNYSGVPTAGQVACLNAQGVDFAIVGAQNETIATQQIAMFQAAGIRCELYLYPYYDDADASRIARALRLAASFKLPRIWDDVEWDDAHDGAAPSATVICAGIADRLRTYRLAGFEAGVYSSRAYWPRLTEGRLDSIIRQEDTPLWVADYRYLDGHAPAFSEFLPFGPWTAPLIWQYAGSVSLCDFNVDRNIWNPDVAVVTAPRPWDPAHQPVEDGLNEAEQLELAERRAKADLDLALLLKYRCQPRPGGKVELLTNEGAPLDPRILIDVRR